MTDSRRTPPHDAATAGVTRDATPPQATEPDDGGYGQPERHPPGLWVLFITEMWERFSYYGMRALLVLYLATSTAKFLPDGSINENPGFGWEKDAASILYGLYTAAVYITPLAGGWLADRLLGTHRSMLIGGWIIAAGHVTLALTEFFTIPYGNTVLPAPAAGLTVASLLGMSAAGQIHTMPLAPQDYYFRLTAGVPVTLETAPGALLCFLAGLVLIVVGTGFFKPCVSVMVGQLYREGDPRRDSGFTIFYMGINLGAFFSPLVAGTLGETVGWHWGFGSAAVGMIAGLFFYQMFRPKYLPGIGDPPREKAPLGTIGLALVVMAALAAATYFIGWELLPAIEDWAKTPTAVESWTWIARYWQWLFWGALVAAGLAAILVFLAKQPAYERGPLGVIFVLSFVGNIFFWAAFEQAGSSLNFFAEESTRRPLWLPAWFRRFCSEPGWPAPWWGVLLLGVVLCVPLVIVAARKSTRRLRPIVASLLVAVLGAGIIALAIAKHFRKLEALGTAEEFPATWYQSVNPLGILLFAPLFSWLWLWLDRRRMNPPTPLKFSFGLYLLGLSFIAMVFGAREARADGLAGPHWLLITYLVVTWGELCLSPVGLSMITRLAPERFQSLMMGLWFGTSALANLFAGLLAAYSTTLEQGKGTFLGEPGLPGFFLMLVVFPIAAGVMLTVLTPVLKRMMRGIQ